ncbi:Cytidine and deoxycytidylate deaminase domain [Trinorchestia longiramus]|nr:Cytidine and deoxycytidylate deaminase domain [Trinorchestia longiramus]
MISCLTSGGNSSSSDGAPASPVHGTSSVVPSDERDEQLKERLSWEEYFMALAFLSSQRSKDPVTQVGACIVNDRNQILSIGYNGMPNGCPDHQMPWGKTSAEPLETKHMYVCHAELNAILNKNSADVGGACIYVTLFPCNECAKLIIQSGITSVVYYSDKHKKKGSTQASKRMLDMAGVEYRMYFGAIHHLKLTFDLSCEGMISGSSFSAKTVESSNKINTIIGSNKESEASMKNVNNNKNPSNHCSYSANSQVSVNGKREDETQEAPQNILQSESFSESGGRANSKENNTSSPPDTADGDILPSDTCSNGDFRLNSSPSSGDCVGIIAANENSVSSGNQRSDCTPRIQNGVPDESQMTSNSLTSAITMVDSLTAASYTSTTTTTVHIPKTSSTCTAMVNSVTGTPYTSATTPSNPTSRMIDSFSSISLASSCVTSEHPRPSSAYLSWDEYFMSVAFLSGCRSRDQHEKSGACLVNKQHRIVGIGYNGNPRGYPDTPPPPKEEQLTPLDKLYACHAEINAVLNKNCSDVRNCSLYVTHFPCNECAKLIVQSGVTEVNYYFDPDTRDASADGAKRLFDLTDIKYLKYTSLGSLKKEFTLDFPSIEK